MNSLPLPILHPTSSLSPLSPLQLANITTTTQPAKEKTSSSSSSSTPQQQQQQQQPQPPPRTPNERSWQLYWATNVHQKEFEELGPHGLSPAALQAYNNAEYVSPPPGGTGTGTGTTAVDVLSRKAQRELWKQAGEANLPLRKLARPRPFQKGRDREGRDLGDYALADFEARRAREHRLGDLRAAGDAFARRRDTARNGGEPRGEHHAAAAAACCYTPADVEAERARRAEMADLRMQLYGEQTASYALDPDWDDVTPIPQAEPEGALAAIAYSDDYAECMFSLLSSSFFSFSFSLYPP